MTQTTESARPQSARRGLFQSLELDHRLLGMIGAFIALCLVFNYITDGRFLTPRNIFNLTIQTPNIDRFMAGNICRCGTYQRIRRAIHRAAQEAQGAQG